MSPRVPVRWPGGTVACLATGPSLTQADVDLVRGQVDGVIAISDAIDLAPWADVLYSCDGKWWKWREQRERSENPPAVRVLHQPNYQGTKYALKDDARKWAGHGVQVLKHTGRDGLERSPDGLRGGANSGYQAINLAVHLGATRILLLGYDMRGQHFFGRHPDGTTPPFAMCLAYFRGLVTPLQQAGVEVINCTRKTALTSFPQEPLESVIERWRRAEVA